MKIDTDFPGGNIAIDELLADEARLRPDLRDTNGEWFYWSFRLREAAGREVTIRFGQKNVIAALGPAASWDGGRTWQWLGADCVSGASNEFRCRIPENVEDARFSMTIPYTQTHWESFQADLGNTGAPGLESGVLCKTRSGHTAEMLHLRALGDEVRDRIVLTARHHSCETMASYVLEGIIMQMAGDTAFRQHTEVLILPFMDKDGVENGDQGKNRLPRDHNRDYDGESVHVETAALRELLPRWGGGKLRVALDLHCPWIHGAMNEKIYFVGSEHPHIWAEQQLLFAQLEKTCQGTVPFALADGLPFGQDWNVAANYALGKTFIRFAAEQEGIRCACTLEVPYALARGSEINPATARTLGRNLACALAAYLGS